MFIGLCILKIMKLSKKHLEENQILKHGNDNGKWNLLKKRILNGGICTLILLKIPPRVRHSSIGELGWNDGIKTN